MAPHKIALSLVRDDLTAALARLPDADPGTVLALVAAARVPADRLPAFLLELSDLVQRFKESASPDGEPRRLALALYPAGGAGARKERGGPGDAAPVAPGLHIRTAGPGDIPALLSLYRQLSPEDPELAPDRAAAILDDFARYPGSAIFVGSEEGELVATCALVVVPNLTRGGAPYALIENVVTESRRRKRGHGRAVLRAAVAAAWRAGCYKVMLMTGRTDPETLSFYRGAGFEQTKTGFQVRRAGM